MNFDVIIFLELLTAIINLLTTIHPILPSYSIALVIFVSIDVKVNTQRKNG